MYLVHRYPQIMQKLAHLHSLLFTLCVACEYLSSSQLSFVCHYNFKDLNINALRT